MFDFDDLEEQFETAEEEAVRQKTEEVEQARRKKEQEAEEKLRAEENTRKQQEESVRKEQERAEEKERDRKIRESMKKEEQERVRKEAQDEALRKASRADLGKPSEVPSQRVEDAEEPLKGPEAQVDGDNGSKAHVRVNFRYKKQTWHHDFEVAKGSTILHLKEMMTKSDVEEVHWFELHRNGRPVSSQEQIHVDLRLDFAFLGPRTAAEAARAEAAQVQAAGKAAPVQEAVDAPGHAVPTAKEALTAGQVDVVVKHAVKDDHCVSVSVSATGTVANVRDAVAKELGDVPSNVRIVSKLSNTSGFKSLAPTEKIGTRRQFLAMCEKLEQLAQDNGGSGSSQARTGGAFMEVTVHLDRSRGFKTVAKIKPGSTVFELKEKLAKSDISGQTRVDNFHLALSSNGVPMDDSDQIMEGFTEIDVVVPPPEGQGTASTPQQVEVAVKHAVSGIRIKVKVPSNGKLTDVRDAVANAMGVKPASEVRLVKRMGTGTFASLGASEPIGSRKEFLAMGREWVPMG